MAIFRNQSKLGDLDIPGVGFVPFGETFEVEGDDAAGYLAQPDVYLLVDSHGDPIERTDLAPADDAPADDAPAEHSAPAGDPADGHTPDPADLGLAGEQDQEIV